MDKRVFSFGQRSCEVNSLCKLKFFPDLLLTGVSSTLAMAASLLAAFMIFFSALGEDGKIDIN